MVNTPKLRHLAQLQGAGARNGSGELRHHAVEGRPVGEPAVEELDHDAVVLPEPEDGREVAVFARLDERAGAGRPLNPAPDAARAPGLYPGDPPGSRGLGPGERGVLVIGHVIVDVRGRALHDEAEALCVDDECALGRLVRAEGEDLDPPGRGGAGADVRGHDARARGCGARGARGADGAAHGRGSAR